MRTSLILAVAALTSAAHAQTLKVSRFAWDGLSHAEQSAIQVRQIIEVYEHGSFGMVIDAQGADRSDAGTNAGAIIGSVATQAAYIDRAFSGHSYSALTQLGLGLLGGVLGSALDRPASQQYQFRYALRLSNGEIQYADAVNRDPFRHPPGVCLSLPELRPISQGICAHGPDDLRRTHLMVAAIRPAPPAAVPSQMPVALIEQTPPPMPTSSVACRIGNLPPVSTTAEKCTAIGGVEK